MELQPRRDGKSEEAAASQSSEDAAPAASPPPPTPSAPPSPPPAIPPPPQDQPVQNQPGPSGDGDPERSPTGGASADKDRTSSFRWLFQQSLGKLPGGMKGEGDTRKAGTECQKLSVCRNWLRATVKDTGDFITGDSKICVILTMAAVAGILHWCYITALFEHDRHFSHLSTLEREMSFRSEMGLYYSYFKTIIEAPSFWKGLWMIMNDRLTEYPLVINTLKRFNLYPEVVLASLYRIYTGTMNALGIQTKACWTVTRGEGLSSVESCEGLGDPASFYIAMIFLLNGFMVSILFMYGAYLSESRLGGLLTVTCYFFNHRESTRVMWTPPLRESFSYPFLVVQMLLLTYILRTQNVNQRSLVALSVSNVFFILPWQFAPFVLLTQVSSVFGIYVVGFIDSCKLQTILKAHMASLAVCFFLMFGNSMLLTSYYAASLVVCWIILEVGPKYLKMDRNDISLWTIEGISYFFGTIILKSLMNLLFGVSDDANITNLLKAKLTGYTDFDISFYTCGAEFDFMEEENISKDRNLLNRKEETTQVNKIWLPALKRNGRICDDTPGRYMKTFLLPLVFFIVLVIVGKTYQYVVHSKKSTERQEDTFKHAEIVYHVPQLMYFTALAILVMRLKLFLTPHMCIMASLIYSKQLFGWIFPKIPPGAVTFILLAIMTFYGKANVQSELDIVGDFSNLPQEELLLWIKGNTKQDDVFAGIMATMASVKLSAQRPVVNHPHYEDAGLRTRTKIVYSMYSRKPAEEVKKELLKMGVNYYILEDFWCQRRTRPGCSMPEIWDNEDFENVGKVPLCTLMSKDSRPYFRTVFHNKMFKVLEVNGE